VNTLFFGHRRAYDLLQRLASYRHRACGNATLAHVRRAETIDRLKHRYELADT
jgi:hypothetical protein